MPPLPDDRPAASNPDPDDGNDSKLVYYLGIIIAIIAVFAVAEFVVQFAAWNKEQSCATGGGRNCGGPRIPLNR